MVEQRCKGFVSHIIRILDVACLNVISQPALDLGARYYVERLSRFSRWCHAFAGRFQEKRKSTCRARVVIRRLRFERYSSNFQIGLQMRTISACPIFALRSFQDDTHLPFETRRIETSLTRHSIAAGGEDVQDVLSIPRYRPYRRRILNISDEGKFVEHSFHRSRNRKPAPYCTLVRC